MSDGSTLGAERAMAEMGAPKLSVRVDGEWCPEVRWYTPNLPVFFAEDGTEVDIRDGGSILYESPDGAVEEIEEPTVDKEATQIYEPMSVYPAETIEVRDVSRFPIYSGSADSNGGESTGGQNH